MIRFSTTVSVKVEYNHDETLPDQRPFIKEVNLLLELSKKLDKSRYFNPAPNNLPNRDGTKSITIALIQGLSANIRQADKMKYWEKKEHLHYIITELHRSLGFDADITPGFFDE